MEKSVLITKPRKIKNWIITKYDNWNYHNSKYIMSTDIILHKYVINRYAFLFRSWRYVNIYLWHK